LALISTPNAVGQMRLPETPFPEASSIRSEPPSLIVPVTSVPMRLPLTRFCVAPAWMISTPPKRVAEIKLSLTVLFGTGSISTPRPLARARVPDRVVPGGEGGDVGVVVGVDDDPLVAAARLRRSVNHDRVRDRRQIADGAAGDRDRLDASRRNIEDDGVLSRQGVCFLDRAPEAADAVPVVAGAV